MLACTVLHLLMVQSSPSLLLKRAQHICDKNNVNMNMFLLDNPFAVSCKRTMLSFPVTGICDKIDSKISLKRT